MNKKGISPLIATVLIIGFTIVLAVLVITWISGTVNEQTESTDCMIEVENVCLGAIGKISGTAEWNTVTSVYDLSLTNEGGDTYGMRAVSVLGDGSSDANVSTLADLAEYATNTETYTSTSGTDDSTLFRIIPVVDNGECSAECEVIEIIPS